MSGWSAWTGLTTAKAARPARDRNEVAVVRIVKACWRGYTWRTARTPHARSVGRRDGERCGICECLLCAGVWMCMAWSLCRDGGDIASSPIQGLRGYGIKNGRQGGSQGDRIVWKPWSLANLVVTCGEAVAWSR